MAIKLVSRVFDKIQLAKRALREITLLRHFTGHANITGLIDATMISPEVHSMPELLLCCSQERSSPMKCNVSLISPCSLCSLLTRLPSPDTYLWR